MKKTVIVVGAGKGLGNSIARKFGKNDFRVVLMARSKDKMEEYARDMVRDGIEAYPVYADASQPETLTKAVTFVKDKFGMPDVLVYNVGVTSYDAEAGLIDSELLMKRYQVDVASAYHCVKLLDSEEFAAKNGAILMTGGGLALHPEAIFTPLSMDKAALRAMAYLLHDDMKQRGIFVGTVTVCGGIKPDTHFAPDLIAEEYWNLYCKRDKCEIMYQ